VRNLLSTLGEVETCSGDQAKKACDDVRVVRVKDVQGSDDPDGEVIAVTKAGDDLDVDSIEETGLLRID
jgi:hypothetical protein